MEQYNIYSLPLILSKEFLIKTFNNPILSVYAKQTGSLYSEVLMDSNDYHKLLFAGVYGKQFTTEHELVDFLDVFRSLLDEKEINKTCEAELLFFSSFFEDRTGEDMLMNYQNNDAIDCAKAVTEILNFRPSSYDQDSILVGGHKRPVTSNFEITFTQDDKIIRLPPKYNTKVLQTVLNLLLEQHKNSSSDFYRELDRKHLDIDKLRSLSNRVKRNHIGKNNLMFRVATLITDYLKAKHPSRSAYDINDFIFKYFCLLKVFPNEGDENDVPNDYSALVHHYKRKGKSRDTIKSILYHIDIQ